METAILKEKNLRSCCSLLNIFVQIPVSGKAICLFIIGLNSFVDKTKCLKYIVFLRISLWASLDCLLLMLLFWLSQSKNVHLSSRRFQKPVEPSSAPRSHKNWGNILNHDAQLTFWKIWQSSSLFVSKITDEHTVQSNRHQSAYIKDTSYRKAS